MRGLPPRRNTGASLRSAVTYAHAFLSCPASVPFGCTHPVGDDLVGGRKLWTSPARRSICRQVFSMRASKRVNPEGEGLLPASYLRVTSGFLDTSASGAVCFTVSRDRPWTTSTGSSACLRTSSRSSTISRPRREPRGEDIIDLGMGNPDQATPKHIVDKLVRGRPQPAQPSLLGLQGHHAAPQGRHHLVPRPLRRRARPGDRGHRDDRRQGGHGPPGPRGAPARRRGARAQSDVSDPLLLGGHRGRRPALGAARAGRRLLRQASGGGPARLAQGQAPDPVVPAQSDHALRGPRLLRQGGGLRQGASPHGGPRLRLRGLRLRRLSAAFVPRGAGGQGRRGRDLLAVEVVQHAGLADGLRVRQPPHDPRARAHQVLSRLRRLPADPDRGHHRAGRQISRSSRRSSSCTGSAATSSWTGSTRSAGRCPSQGARCSCGRPFPTRSGPWARSSSPRC